jgi:predicted phage terminase large subunit-like protein
MAHAKEEAAPGVSGLLTEVSITEIEAAMERQRRGINLEQEALELANDLRAFVKRAWPQIWQSEPYVAGWHIDAICAHLEAVSAGEIRKLQVWVPPGTSKSSVVSVCWPVWEWISRPSLRYITASYDLDLATGFAVKSRDLIRSGWFQDRWPQLQLKRDQDLKRSYANTRGGERLATSPSGQGTGKHAHRIVIDDAMNAREVVSEAKLAEVADWHDGTLSTRFADPKTGVEVIIQQRLAERDLAGHVLGDTGNGWHVLCLPERYEAKHPFVCPREVVLPSGRVLPGDLREEEGALLCPERVGPAENAQRVEVLGAHRAAGQLQQRPAAREGAILKRGGWRFYPARFLEGEREYLPRFTGLLQSWDTAFKDRTSSDYVVGGLWGQLGADLYLLALRRDRMGLSATKDAMRAMTAMAADGWPRLPMRVLIEKSANGVEIIEELKREIRGIVPVVASTSKVARAEAAEPALEAGNVYLPGQAEPGNPSGYNEALTPAFAQALVEECAVFPNGQHDDQVDMFTQAVNWSRGRRTSGRIASSSGRVPATGDLAGIGSWDR